MCFIELSHILQTLARTLKQIKILSDMNKHVRVDKDV